MSQAVCTDTLIVAYTDNFPAAYTDKPPFVVESALDSTDNIVADRTSFGACSYCNKRSTTADNTDSCHTYTVRVGSSRCIMSVAG